MRPRLAFMVGLLSLSIVAACTGNGDGDRDGGTGEGGRDSRRGAAPMPMPLPRTEVAGTLWRGSIVVAGGLTADGAASERVDGYDPEADRWERLPDLPVPLHHAGLAALGDTLYAVGGYTSGAGGEWAAQDAVYVLGPNDSDWKRAAPLPEARGGLAVTVAGDRLYAIGGVVAAGVSAKVESFDGSTWQREPDLGTAREHLAAVAIEERIFAIAGRAPGNLTTVESIAIGEPRWRTEPALGHARSGIAAARPGPRACVVGGEGPEGTIGPIECFDGTKWGEVGRLATARHGLAAVAYRGKLHVIGGGPQPGLTVSAVHEVIDTEA